MKTGYRVCDAMTKKPVVVSKDTSIKDCAQMMRVNDVGSLLIGDDSALAGIITDEDIVRNIIAVGISPDSAQVHEHMEKNLITVSPEKDIFEALQLMMEEKIRQLPVMDDDTMIGLLTLKDILRIEPELFDLIADKMEVKEEEHKAWTNEGVCQECGNFVEKLLSRNEVLICKECNK